jgi:(1->4)-alpha-D-glucan 1-alpha-D-glucosylmutase
VELHSELGEGLSDFETVMHDAKREVAKRSLQAEVQRLVEVVEAIGAEDIRLRDHSKRSLARAVTELLVAVPIYRAYVVPGEEPTAGAVTTLETAVAEAAERVPDLTDELEALRDLALGRYGRSGRKDEFIVRFQQTCGPVMAKGVEDTAFYRWYPLVSLCEVGGDPTAHGTGVGAFHEWAARQLVHWPQAMTTLSTHDTKRSEDLRLRLAVLSELSSAAAEAFTAFRWASERHVVRGAAGQAVPSPQVEYLVWQNLVGAWPISLDRLSGYVQKALREAKQETSWQSVDEKYEADVQAWLAAVLDDPVVTELIETLVARLDPFARSNSLSAKLVQLTMPGVPDIYQGCEAVDRSLVDPDNRRAVDFAARASWSSAVAATAPAPGDLDAEKVLVVRTALRLRRELAESFDGDYTPLVATGVAAEHLVAFGRGSDIVTVATRLAARLDARGGWGDTTLTLPSGTWVDSLTGVTSKGEVRLADLLASLPVALLVRTD